jgi:hypothetical protein
MWMIVREVVSDFDEGRAGTFKSKRRRDRGGVIAAE